MLSDYFFNKSTCRLKFCPLSYFKNQSVTSPYFWDKFVSLCILLLLFLKVCIIFQIVWILKSNVTFLNVVFPLWYMNINTHQNTLFSFYSALIPLIETESENEFRPLDERIDEFHPKATRTLFIGNLEKTTTYHDLRNIFQRFGEIVVCCFLQ